MSSVFTPIREKNPALAGACDRLVRPDVTDPEQRGRHGRLIASLAILPLPLAIGVWMSAPEQVGVANTVCIVSAILALCAAAVLSVSVTARIAPAAVFGLVALMVGAGGLGMAAGGLASPMALMIAALPLEAWLVTRDKRWMTVGCACSAAVAAAAFGLELSGFAMGGAAPWHWLAPAAYAATIVPRWTIASGTLRKPAAAPLSLAEIEAVTDSFALELTPSGDVTDAGGACPAKLGVSGDLLLGSGLFDRIHVGDRVTYLCAISGLREQPGKAAAQLRIRVARPEGEPGQDIYRPFTLEFSRRHAEEAAIIAVGRADRDVPQPEPLSRNESLEQAKNRFLAVVSHELRTPLNSIIGFSDVLLHDTFGALANPKQREYVELVRASGHHLLEVVNAILDVSKIEAGAYAMAPEPFRFGEAVDLCVAMLEPQARQKGIDVEVRVPADIGDIRADRRAVQQILINLVSNALKFTPHKGTVMVGAKRVGTRLHFWVSDSGIGISREDLARLGRPFTQVQNDYTRQFEGTGLGLALVRGLVSLHNGTLAIDSTPGQGTTVTVSMPMEIDDAAEHKPVEPAPVIVRTGGVSNGAFRKAG